MGMHIHIIENGKVDDDIYEFVPDDQTYLEQDWFSNHATNPNLFIEVSGDHIEMVCKLTGLQKPDGRMNLNIVQPWAGLVVANIDY